MNYGTEPWYKLFLRESTDDRVLPAFNRSLRDFLLRLAKSRNDGTILRKTESPGKDVARAIGAHPKEVTLVAEYVNSMLEDGYLSHDGTRLWITNFVEAQNAKSPGAKRQDKWRDKPVKSPETSGDGNGGVSRDARETDSDSLERRYRREEERRDEERRDETTGAQARDAAAPVGKVPCPPDLILTESQSATLLTSGIPEYAQKASTAKFVAKACADESDLRTLVTWRKCLSSAVSGDWNNPQTRPKSDVQRRAAEGTNADWPTDDALRTRENIRAGREGKSLQAKERAGNMDYVTALRLIRERNAEIAERAAERRRPSSRPPPGLAADVPGGSLATLAAGIGRTIT